MLGGSELMKEILECLLQSDPSERETLHTIKNRFEEKLSSKLEFDFSFQDSSTSSPLKQSSSDQ